jgi:hypothetical protein
MLDEFLRVLEARRSCAGMSIAIVLQFTRVLEGRILSEYGVSVGEKSLDCGRADKVQDIGNQSDLFFMFSSKSSAGQKPREKSVDPAF